MIAALHRYMEQRSGRLLVFLDVAAEENWAKLQQSGLEEFLGSYGVTVTDEFVMRLPPGERTDPRHLLVTPPGGATENPLVWTFSEWQSAQFFLSSSSTGDAPHRESDRSRAQEKRPALVAAWGAEFRTSPPRMQCVQQYKPIRILSSNPSWTRLGGVGDLCVPSRQRRIPCRCTTACAIPCGGAARCRRRCPVSRRHA